MLACEVVDLATNEPGTSTSTSYQEYKYRLVPVHISLYHTVRQAPHVVVSLVSTVIL
jgi:hypothetical protein